MFGAVVLDLQEGFLGFFELASRRRCNTIVPVKVVIVDEIRPDRLQIDEHIVKLLQDEEAARHALTARNGVTLRG